MATADVASESWEDFNAEALFPPPRLHVNHLTKIDKKEITKVDAPEDQGEMSGSSNPEEIGDTYSDAPVGQNHVDDMFEMEGLEGGTPDERELKADKEIDQRTEESEPSNDESAETDQSSGDEQASDSGSAQDPSSDESNESKPTDSSDEAEQVESDEEEGTDAPIQKESENVDEVAEATSKTSEDVHGGDEATKDIEDSPNAANDGQNPENKGAESGEDGEQGEGDSGEGETQGGGDPSELPQQEATTAQDASVHSEEDWEAKADQSVYNSQRLYEELAKVDHVRPASAAGGGAAVDYSGESWDSRNLRAIFFKTRELIKKLVNEEDVTSRESGTTRWWAEELVDAMVSFRHHRIPSAKYDRPKENNIVFFMDVSGSVSSLAELFMAIMGGAAGLPGVRIVVGSEAHAENEIFVEKPFKSVDKAINFFRNSVNAHVCDDPHCTSCKGHIRNVRWRRRYEHQFEPGIVAFLEEHGLFNATTTCVFFGDMQGVHFDTPELRKIVRTCKCLWLFTDEPGHYTHTGDLPKAIEAGLPIVYNVRDARSFGRAVRRI